MSDETGNLEQGEQAAAEVEEVRYILEKKFYRYVRVSFWAAFIIVYGWIALLFVLVYNFISLQNLNLKLKKYDATDVFCEFGKPLVMSMLLSLTMFLALPGLERATFGMAGYGFLGHMNLRFVYEYLNQYAVDHGGQYPQEDWFEVLYPEDLEKRYFKDYNVVLNPSALELGEDMPDDMVLGFATEKDCGRIGALEDGMVDSGFIWVITGDGKARAFTISQAKRMRWNIKEKGDFEVNKAGVSAIVGVLLLASMAMVIKYGKNLKDNKIFLVMTIILSVICGMIFGMASRSFYVPYSYESDFSYRVCSIAGGGLALLFSLAYSALMPELKRRSDFDHFAGWACVYGSLAGILCSVSLHMIFRLLFFEDSYIYILAGVPFGAWAGMFVGWLVGQHLDRQKV